MKVKNLLLWIAFAFASLTLTISCTTPPSSPDVPTELTISSAIALTEPLEALKPIYQESHPNVTITYNFGASGE